MCTSNDILYKYSLTLDCYVHVYTLYSIECHHIQKGKSNSSYLVFYKLLISTMQEIYLQTPGATKATTTKAAFSYGSSFSNCITWINITEETISKSSRLENKVCYTTKKCHHKIIKFRSIRISNTTDHNCLLI